VVWDRSNTRTQGSGDQGFGRDSVRDGADWGVLLASGMASLWDAADSERIRTRIGRLLPDTFPRWGSFTSPQMVCHLCDSLRLIMGEIQAAPINKLLHVQPFKALALYVLPWPKGARSAPELLETKPGEWMLDIATLLELHDQCVITISDNLVAE